MNSRTEQSNNAKNNLSFIDEKTPLQVLHKFEDALNKAIVVAIVNRQGALAYVNEFLCDISHYNRSELIGKNYWDSDLHSIEFLTAMYRKLETDGIWKGEIKNKRKDESIYWIQATMMPFLIEDGRPVQYILIGTDCTQQKQVEASKKNHEINQIISDHSTELFSLMDRNGSFLYMSPSFTTLLEYDIAEMKQMNFFEKIHPEDVESVKKNMLSYCSRTIKKALELEFRIAHKKGHYMNVEANISGISEQSFQKGDMILVVMRDIHTQKEAEQAIYQLAFFDPLTSLPNRRSFMNKLQNEIMKSKLQKSTFSILLLNINNFKLVNAQWGHDVGDLVLQETANTIKSVIQRRGRAAHLGGDEFIVLLKNLENEQELLKVVQEILLKFEKPLQIDNQEYEITVGIGGANYPDHGETPEDLIKNADTALRSIKENGKSNFMIFNKKMKNESLERRLLESALRKGIDEQQFYLEYQPKMNMSTKELVGMEALVRWNHPDLGIIPPCKFISLAEETGLIVPLGEWILRESCRQTKEWQEAGLPPLVVSVNVSVRQLAEPKFIEKVKAILKETGLDPKWLEIEITESVLVEAKSTVAILKEIQACGIQISIDDFGTGYSSLSYIKDLPINTLKVDQSFVKDIHVNEDSRAIALAIINLANSMGLNVIAEGVELQEHVDELSKEGYILGQGYFYSKPLKVEAFEQYINRKRGLLT